MIKKIGIIVNSDKDIGFINTKKIINLLLSKKIIVNITVKLAGKLFIKKKKNINVLPTNEISKKSEVLILLGGDGTFLGVVRNLFNNKTKFLPVNIGNLGFISEIKPNELLKIIDNIIFEKFVLEKRNVLSYSIKSNNVNGIAVNDVLISQQSLNRIIKYKIFLNDNYFAELNADGLIISTPTGSTAHSLSAGGPIVNPVENSIILNPLCAHSLSVRPLVLNKKDIIKVKLIPIKKRKTTLTVDGQSIFDLSESDEIIIKNYKYCYKLIKLNNKTYYQILKEKFKWTG